MHNNCVTRFELQLLASLVGAVAIVPLMLGLFATAFPHGQIRSTRPGIETHFRRALMKLCPSVWLISALQLVLCSALTVRAQTTTSGGLTGVVTDPSGAIVPNANIEIKDDAKGTSLTTKTGGEGIYTFFFVAPNTYMLTVAHEGFQKQSRFVRIPLGPPVTVNITLEIRRSSATVRVTGDVALIQAENGDVSTTMNQKQASEVPNPGNDLTYLAQTAPGAIMNTDTIGGSYLGKVSFLGMPGTSNLFTVNGMNNNNTQLNTNNSGALGMLLGLNEVQEASIVSNGYSAQFGGAAGSIINILTKSGGNALHGNAAYYWNGRALNANDWIDNAEGNPRPFDMANQWAGSLGGPIIKDKLFFFFDAEGMRLVLPSPTFVILPTTSFESATMKNIDSIFGPTSASHNFYRQIFNLYNSTPGANNATAGNFSDTVGCNGWTDPNDPNDPNGLGVGQPCAVHFFENLYHPASESIVSGRADWNIGTNDHAFWLLQYDYGQRATYLDPISSAFNAYTNQPWWQSQLSETHSIGTTAANQFLLAGTYINSTTSVANPVQTHSVFPTVLNWGNAGGAFSSLGGSDFLYALPTGSKTTSYQVSDDLVNTRGQHRIDIGILFQGIYFVGDGYINSGTGQLAPQTINAFFYGGTAPSAPATDFTTLQQNFPLVTWNHIRFSTLGFYGQDQWHARSNLTLTLALRAEHESDPVCATACFARLAGSFDSVSRDPALPFNQAILTSRQAFPSIDSILWSPRFSFAWQPLGLSHNTVLRGGIGIFHDPVPGVLGTTFAYNPPLVNSYFISRKNLAPGEVNSLSKNADASNSTFNHGFASGETLAQLQAADPNFAPPGIQALPDTLHSPQYQKWSLQWQQSLGASASLTLGYLGNHGIHEFLQDVNANGHNFGPYPAAPCSSPPLLPCYDSRFSFVAQYGSSAISNYNGVIVSIEKRITKWGSGLLQVNYTYGQGLDEISNGGIGQFTFGSPLVPQNGSDLRGSYGAADYDVRHSMNANYMWEVPFKEVLRGHGPGLLLQGWQVSGTVFARTGFPYTVTDFAEAGKLGPDNIFGPIYSVPVAPLGPQGPCGKGAVIPSAPVPCLPPEVLSDGATPNPNALFIQSSCETGFNTGNLPGSNGPCSGRSVSFGQGRNRFRGPGYWTTDVAIMKSLAIPHWGNGEFTIGFQLFNLFNHPNFGFPDMSSSDAAFGRIFYEEQPPTSILGSGLNANVSGRMIQVKAQIRF